MKNRRISYPRIFGVFALIIIFIFGFDSLKRNAARKTAEDNLQSIISVVTQSGEPPDAANGQDGSETTSEKSIRVDDERYYKIEKTSDDLGVGSLVLVNDANEYHFPDISDKISLIYESMNSKHYKLSYLDHEGHDDMITQLNAMMESFYTMYSHNDVTVTSALRSYEKEQELYNNSAGSNEYIPKPGFSEHHTGYAVDFTLVSDSSKITPYDGTGDYKWINDNCYKYGFIVRYPEDKTEQTGVSYEPWHFRYVGIPHSFIMNEQKMCFEEYIEYLKNFQFAQEHLKYSVYGYNYEIYYVPAEEDKTTVAVPSDRSYTISGNNTDGFIVTVCEAGSEITGSSTSSAGQMSSSDTGASLCVIIDVSEVKKNLWYNRNTYNH